MTMMNEILNTAMTLIAGLALGIIFFGGLWLTVRKMIHSKKPALWLLSSFIFRVGITLVGFYFVGAGNMQKILICLVGFIAARFVVLHFTKNKEPKNLQVQKEVNHEA